MKLNKENDNVWSFGDPFITQYIVIFNAEESHVWIFKGNRVDYLKEWTEWDSGSTFFYNTNQMFYPMVGAAILGVLLLLLVIFIIVHSIKRRRLEEHRPLINDGNDHN